MTIIQEAILKAYEVHCERVNLVLLSVVRRAVPVSRTTFDSALRELRKDGIVVLNSFDGRHGRLSQEDIEAAILEGGRRYEYMSLR